MNEDILNRIFTAYCKFETENLGRPKVVCLGRKEWGEMMMAPHLKERFSVSSSARPTVFGLEIIRKEEHSLIEME